MQTATRTVKKAAPKNAAKKAAPKRPASPADPRSAERAKAVSAALARLAAKAPEAVRQDAPKAAPTKAAPKPAAKPAQAKGRKMGALEAAAVVLADATKPMRAKEIVTEMGKRGLWTSPGGKTPEATLYSAMIREIGAKGTASRFAKAGKGEFASTKKGGA